MKTIEIKTDVKTEIYGLTSYILSVKGSNTNVLQKWEGLRILQFGFHKKLLIYKTVFCDGLK